MDEENQEMILLDTHALVWLKAEPTRLSTRASEAIRAARESDGLAIAAITLWELAWLASHGRLNFTGTVDAFVDKMASSTTIRPITARIAVLANQLPASYPSDPSDRLIGSTALAEGMPLITKDLKIRNFRQIKTIW